MLSREKPVVWNHFLERFNHDKIVTRHKNQQQGNSEKLLRLASKMNKLILLGSIKFSALYIRQSGPTPLELIKDFF